jgi:hypothetical protein
MGLFEFFFPEIAEATHLRRISKQMASDSYSRIRSEQITRDNAEQAVNAMQELREENGLLTMLVMGIMRKLCEHTSATIDEIKGLLFELDAADGKVDGKLDMAEVRRVFGIPDPSPDTNSDDLCGKCKRPIPERQKKCLYCGWTR